MKFTANSSELQRALQKIGGVIPTRSTMPILECMLFDLTGDMLTISATDLEITFTISLKVKGNEDGRIAIPGKRIVDTVRAMADTPLTVVTDSNSSKISITTESGKYSLTGEDAKEFPPVEEFEAKNEFSIESGDLKKIIDYTAFAVSTDELRPAMMGVLIQSKNKELRAVSTDGHRLVRLTKNMSKAIPLERDIIIPSKALTLAGKSLDQGNCTVSVSESHVRFTFDNTVLTSKLIADRYPNYESVIPLDNDKQMSVNRNAIMNSVRRVALYASATTHQVRMALSTSGLTISAQDQDFGGEAKEAVPSEYNGESMEIGFNATYLFDILSHLEGEQATFKFSAPTRAGIVCPAEKKSGEDILMLVMPVRLNN